MSAPVLRRTWYILFLLLGLVAPVTAATRNWSGASNTLWSNPANWSNGVPTAGDSLNFPHGAANLSMSNDLPSFTQFGNVSFADNYTLNGNSLSLSGGIIAQSGTTVVLADITLMSPQSWDVDAQAVLRVSSTNLNGLMLTINSNGQSDSSISSAHCSAGVKGAGSLVVNGQGNTLIDGVLFNGLTTNNGSLTVLFNGGPKGPVVNYGLLTLESQVLLPGGLTNYGVLDSESVGMSSLDLKSGSTFQADFALNHADTNIQADSALIEGATLDVHCGFFLNPGDTRAIIRSGPNPIQGMFASLPEGSVVTSSLAPQRFRLSYAANSGQVVTLTSIGERPTSISVSRSSTFRVGSPMSFNVKVLGTHGNPTGDITIVIDDEILRTQTLDATGSASVTLPPLAAGTQYKFRVVYAGDAIYTGAARSVFFDVLPLTQVPLFNPIMLAALLLILAAVALTRLL